MGDLDMRYALPCCLLTILLSIASPLAADTAHSQEDLRQLAARFEHGRGVRQDYMKAFQLYCLAVERGDTRAYYDLGWMYFNHRGVDPDPSRAAGWFMRGADTGDRLAKKMLTILAGITPRPDPNCTPLSKDQQPDRTQITHWVRRWAPEYGLDADLVLAVIAAESAFNPQAHSSKNARGLMQLIPATAKRFGVDDIWDPAQNMRGGMAYLQWLIQRFDGDVSLVLAAYNAGESAVKNYQGIPPYRETQDYIKRIIRSYQKPTHPPIESLTFSMISY